MLPKQLRNVIDVSRRAAKDFKRALEEVAEQLAQRQAQQLPQRVPIRVPVRTGNSGHPLAGWQRRQFSTAARSFTRSSAAKSQFQAVKRSVSVSRLSKDVMFRVQPFGGSLRPKVGSSLYSCFPRQNARMFSTYGPDITAQAVQNLSQGLRAFFLQAAQMHLKQQQRALAMRPVYGGDHESSPRMASRAVPVNSGCFVEFDLSASAAASASAASAASAAESYLDDATVSEVELFVAKRTSYLQQMLQDIRRLKANIGSPACRRLAAPDGGLVLRFYFPNCDADKMEGLLVDNEITTGMVHQCSEPGLLSDQSRFVDTSVGSDEIRDVLSTSPGLTDDSGCSEDESGSLASGSWYVADVLSNTSSHMSSVAMVR